jgi:hypothetical protein
MAGRASRQEGVELGAAAYEILQLLRRLASQSGPMEMMPVPSPVQVPGTAHTQPALGRSNR